MDAEYDLFLSYAHVDVTPARAIAEALRDAGLRVWFDERAIEDHAGITGSIREGLARAKALLAYYSATYPRRRACQWELTAAFLAAQRAGDPRQRVLVVNPEPGQAHIHPVELRDAKYQAAPAPGNAAALKQLAIAVKTHVDRLQGALGAVLSLTPPQWFGMQGVGSTRFVGRLPDLWRVHSGLQAAEVPVITDAVGPAIVQVRGVGGVGKSLLAEEYALRFGAAYPGGVFWLRAYGNDGDKVHLGPEGQEAERARQIRLFALKLGVPVEGLGPEEIEHALAREIDRRKLSCLWVVDDVPSGLDGQALRRWFAPHPLAKTLFTTRSRAYGALATPVDLGVLPEDDAYQLLTIHRRPQGAHEEDAARGLIRDLGGHALAVDVAGAALRASIGLQSGRQRQSAARSCDLRQCACCSLASPRQPTLAFMQSSRSLMRVS